MTKFLIIRFSSIGDIVLTTPVVRCLKNQVKDAEIHFLTKKQYVGVLESNLYISQIHSFEGDFKKIILELKAEKFDYIIDLHNNLRTLRLKFALRVKSFSFDKLNLKKWLFVNFKINKLPYKHIVDRYLETVKTFNIENDGRGLDYFIDIKSEVNLLKLPGDFPYGFVVFAIGAQHATKRLPTNKIIAICQSSHQNIILLGGKEDEQTGNFIALSSGKNVFNGCGKFALNQSASLVRQAKVVITHDTGLMHIAAAYKKRIVSFWGSTVPEFGMTPYLSDEKSLVVQIKGLNCRPCSKIGFKECPKKHFNCMQAIDAQKIAQLIDWLAMPGFDENVDLTQNEENVQAPK